MRLSFPSQGLRFQDAHSTTAIRRKTPAEMKETDSIMLTEATQLLKKKD